MDLVRIFGNYFAVFVLLLQVSEIFVSAKESIHRENKNIRNHENLKHKQAVFKNHPHQKPITKDDIKETLDEIENAEVEKEEFNNVIGETKQGPDQQPTKTVTHQEPKPASQSQQQAQSQKEQQETQMMENQVLEGAAQGPQTQAKPESQQQAQTAPQTPPSAPAVTQNAKAQPPARCTPQQLAAQQQLQQAQEALRMANQQAAQNPQAAGCAMMYNALASNSAGGGCGGGLPSGAASGDNRYQYGSNGMNGPGGVYGSGGLNGKKVCPPGYGPPGSEGEMPFGSPGSDIGFGMDPPCQSQSTGSCKSKFEHCKKQCVGDCPKRCCRKEKKGKKE